MVYLFESELPENKSVFLSLVHIYGFGKIKSLFVCKRLGFSRNFKARNLSKEHISKLTQTIEQLNLKLASDLKKSKLLSTKKLIAIKSYKGLRKIRGLPARGQRTHGPKFVDNARFKDIRQTTYLKNAVKGAAIICSSIGQCTKTRLNAISLPTCYKYCVFL